MMRTFLSAAAIAAWLVLASPAAAQSSGQSYELGPYWNVSAIDVKEGHFEEFMGYLADRWRRISEFSRQQGWIIEYHVLSNVFPRENEPDLYLMTRYADFPSTAEFKRREQITLRHLQTDRGAVSRQIGELGRIRTLRSQMLLRELTLGR